MTDDDAKDVAKAIEKIINRKKIHISVEKAKQICATIKMMEAVGYDMKFQEPDNYANPATCGMPSVAPQFYNINYVGYGNHANPNPKKP